MAKDLDVIKQSENAFKQWGPQWREHAKQHSKYIMKDLIAFQNIGIGKACLVIANGHSFEKNIETIKQYQHNVDIMCVDKCLAHCLNNGITPTYVLVCDANVSYEKYLQPVEDKLQNSILLINVCANPRWSANGNWKERYFFVNKDCLGLEKEFCELSGCPNVIPAGTNVSNAAIIMLTQSDNNGRKNFFGYDKLLMIGFDYCWSDESYYAFDRDGGGKRHYMKQVYGMDLNGDFVYTSPNLLFSARWMDKYIKTFRIAAIQCAKSSLLTGFKVSNLNEQMAYKYRTEDAKEVNSLLEYRRMLSSKIEAINSRIFDIGRDHFRQLIRTT